LRSGDPLAAEETFAGRAELTSNTQYQTWFARLAAALERRVLGEGTRTEAGGATKPGLSPEITAKNG
jgi:hypothetical protein